MSKINLYSDKNTTATSVPNVFIDEYMSGANGEFVKIYLYLLRQLNSVDAGFSLSEIADKFEHTEKDVKRALCYWERMQLLHLDYDTDENLIGVQVKTTSSNDGSSDSKKTVELSKGFDPILDNAPNTNTHPEKKSYSADEIQQFSNQEAIQELFFITEQYVGKQLTITDMNTIFYWYEELNFSVELIEYLIEYSVSNGHTSLHYMNKTALNWHENHIKSVEDAKLTNGQFNRTHAAIMNRLGINKRGLVPSEIAYIDKWKNDYGFSLEMILAACDKTIGSTSQPSFIYTDKILTEWKSSNIRTLPDIVKADSARQNKKRAATAVKKAAVNNTFNNFDQRIYDNDALEKMLFATQNQ